MFSRKITLTLKIFDNDTPPGYIPPKPTPASAPPGTPSQTKSTMKSIKRGGALEKLGKIEDLKQPISQASIESKKKLKFIEINL
jgi:hypothetical protein